MTTTAQAIPSLEVSAPDDNMDVLSDTGFDFGDGDIDLDLDTAPSVQDDDMSLNDAATDGGVDMEEPSGDQDDFMADHGDLIDEDDVYNDGGAASAVSQIVDESATTFEADMLAPPDEDLIDYSDDEEQQQIKMHSPSVHDGEEMQASLETENTSVPVDDPNQNDQVPGEAETADFVEDSHSEAQTREADVTEILERTEASPERQSADNESQREDNAEDSVNFDDGGVPLPADEHSYSHLHSDDNAVTELQDDLQQENGDDVESNDHNVQLIELRPVTVNYAGNELWLFKQHDLEESGDFLLEDLSVAKSSMSDLFHACRMSLGDDVSGEHEIGFQFDHLHNLELYEDNTACVAVSLERLVDLYHTLQAQDGNDDPECFYITLQFRPRFATLLADVAQYAEQGSGYSALDAAVAAGETHFSNVFSSASTEHDNAEWDDDEDENDASSPGSVHSTALEEAGAAEHEHRSQEGEDDPEEHEEQGENLSQEHQQGVETKDEWDQTVGTLHEESHSTQENVSPDSPTGIEEVHDAEPAVSERYASETQDQRTPDQIAHDKQEADDFVDYSDDEDNQDTKEPSPSSSTVQGDEPTEVQESDFPLEHKGDDEPTAADGFVENDDDATLLTQTQYDDDANHYAFQDYTETYEQGDTFQDYQADGPVGDPFESNETYNGDTDQDFANYNFQDLDGEVNLGFDEQPPDNADYGDHGNDSFEAVEDITHADALLDLDNAPEWAIDADPAPNLPGEDAVLLHDDDTAREEDEGGVVEPPVVTSPAAEPTLSSSNDHELLSPQGQKRSIDEVGDGIDDAPNSTGMAPRSSQKRQFDADYLLDAKRPRV
ncbi:hypothetical protein OPT61_g1954 [Boeremia exigua]|uniref:Uncharacterized protein n=1 Tax=Boeremia exigua TaxID=749465 RepID=A0ACC2IN86_9PLEO|nr:hypothetical protein OPT61_g1954 [Boeremia exigua]